MEVHSHLHTPGKKWTHYLWEFIMLFLAVFCGFLAENIREHAIEHQREKQFLVNLVIDLEQNRAQLKYSVNYYDAIVKFRKTTETYEDDYLQQVYLCMSRVLNSSNIRKTMADGYRL